ncbi:MAG TPA: ATP-binding protein [Gemmatimonadales bacterium]|nr:ATP-binding protein [Gemmatimonadales bacterium]
MPDLDSAQVTELIAFIGTIVQATVAVLLAGLFFLLSRRAGRRPYVVAWSWALVALTAAIGSVVASYAVQYPVPSNGFQKDPIFLVHVFQTLYLFSKLMFGGLLVFGAAAYAGRAPSRSGVQWMIAALGLFSIVTVALLRTLDRIVVIQALAVAPMFAAGAVILRRLPAGRRGLGSRLTMLVCVVNAVLWLVYSVSFGLIWAHEAMPGYVNPLGALLRANPFIDTVMEMLLAFGLVVMINDQVEREVEEERSGRLNELAAASDRLGAVIRAAVDAIVLLDADGRVTLSNAAADLMFAPPGGTAAGKRFSDCVADAERASLAGWLGASIGADTPNRSFLGLRPDGTSFSMEASAAEVSLGGAVHRLLVIRDITVREKAEAERLELQNRLAQFEKSEALGRLISGITHELNNPLAAILAAISDLLETEPEGTRRQGMSAVYEQAQRCRLITRNLVYFIRGGEGQRQETSAVQVVTRAVDELRQEAARRQVTLTLDVPESVPSLMADPVALEQVVANLTLNAMEAADQGGRVRIVLSTRDGRLSLVVEDNGPGIPPLLLSRIFDPFFTRKPAGRGSGLGLPVALGIIQHHGGTLMAENIAPPGRGARVSAEIPLGPGRRRPSVEEKPAAPTLRRALIVDDEAPVRSPLRRFLERRGWQVVEAEDGEQGLRILRGRELPDFDLILSDLKMPGMSGMDLHNRLLEERPELLQRIVFITGDVVSPDVAEFLKRNARPVLEKPFELTELDLVVARLSAPPPEIDSD